MATKAKLKGSTAMIADPKKEGIPVELQTQNRKPLTPEQIMRQAELGAATKKHEETAKRYPDKPKGTSIEEWEAHLASKLAEKEAKKAEREAAKPTREAKPKLREGKISVAQIAQEMGILPRVARGMLRDAKWKKPEGGWVYAPGDAQIDAVKALLKAGPTKKASKGDKKPATPKKPEPASTIKAGGAFTSKLKKAGVKKTVVKPAKVISSKEQAKLDAKAAIKTTKAKTGKKPVVTKVPEGVTSK